MSLKHALLGFLTVETLSGYDLKKVFDASINNFWSANHSQIYRTLNALEREGLLDVEVVVQHDRPNKKLYHVTDAGRAELGRWLTTPPTLPPVHHTLLLQLAFAAALPDEAVIALLEGYAAQLRERLALYRGEGHQQNLDAARDPRERLLWKATLDNGITTYEAELRWAEDLIDQIRALASDPPADA